MRFEQTFKELNGRDADAADILRFERLCKALGTTPNDALLAVLVALDYYQSMYEKIPEKIKKESESVLASFKLAAEKTATSALKTSEAAHTQALFELADKVAVQASTKSMFRWAAGCITLVFAMLIPTLYFTHSVGVESGKALGYSDEKAAAAELKADIAQMQAKVKILEKKGGRILITDCGGRLCIQASSNQGPGAEQWKGANWTNNSKLSGVPLVIPHGY